jgi:hypothetical protein
LSATRTVLMWVTHMTTMWVTHMAMMWVTHMATMENDMLGPIHAGGCGSLPLHRFLPGREVVVVT